MSRAELYRDYRGYHGLNVPKESEICDGIHGSRSSEPEIVATDAWNRREISMVRRDLGDCVGVSVRRPIIVRKERRKKKEEGTKELLDEHLRIERERSDSTTDSRSAG